ncbi:hypothetical protein HNP46_005640 [Pseudomonas nitritireducens]|uniref:BapA prefix-like domain-containing protein n=1 Tax=Pseudomonas nitroreducens TaxID=46680 RepID=A0A7W7KR62_PSENT|nr:Ig-like domain-containing protein [Pseudomonas nitritireducens]MBB4866733.1 hypothetical protein [Pseudomonas nitritireducens]
MAIQAKVVASEVQVATGTQQTVNGSIVLNQASNVALNVTSDAVASYQQVGADLLVQLKDGETVRIANFFAEGQPPSQLYLVDENGDLVVTELDQVAADGLLVPTYAQAPIDAGFESLTGAEAAAGVGAAGAAGGIAGLGVAGTILAGAAVIAGGAAIASSGGGGGGGGGGSSNPPPDPASGVTISPDGTSISGQAKPGSTVEVDVNGDGKPDYSAPVDGNGHFQIPLNPPLSNGENATVTVRNPNGGSSSSGVSVTAPDTSAPGAPSDVTLSDNGHTISGSAEPGSTVKVDTNGDGIADATGVAGSDGHFQISLPTPVNDGQSVSVTATDAAGNTSAATVISAPDTSPPAAAQDLAISANGETLSGVAEAGSSLSIDLNNDGVPDLTVQVGPDGHFSITLNSPLPAGQIVSIIVRDAAGNASQIAYVNAPNANLPAPVIDPSNGHLLQGTGTLGTTVYLSNAQGTLIGVAVVGGDGRWSVTPFTPLPDGTVVTAVARGPQGVSGPTSITVDGVAPPAPTVELSNGHSLSGTAEANAKVIITDGNGNPIGQATADGSGHWSFAPSSPLANGTVVKVVAQDAAGNTSAPVQTTVDAVAPNAPTVNPSNGEVFSGNAEPNSTVRLLDGNGHLIGEATANGSGQWSFTPTTPLPNGTQMNVIAMDAAGNVSLPTPVTVDSSIVAAPLIDPSNGTLIQGTAGANLTIILQDANGNPIGQTTSDGSGHWSFTPASPLPNGTVVKAIAENAAGGQSQPAQITVDSVAPPAPTVDASNGHQLIGTAEANAKVIITDGNGNPIGEVNADGNGHWSFTPGAPLPDGTVVKVVAQDAAGNTSQPAQTTVDAQAPAAPTIDASNGSVLNGTAEPGSTVTLTNGAGQPIGQVTADPNTGHWTYTPSSPLPNGSVVNATATDAAGNTSGAATTTVDASVVAPPVIDPSNGSVVSGTAGANLTIRVLDASGNLIGVTHSDGSGHWSFTLGAPLANGTVVKATAVNGSGTESQAAQVTVDAIAPDAPTVAASNGQVLSGTAEANAKVIITNGAGVAIGQTTADGSGHWSFTPSAALANGTIVKVVAQDAAGNTSGAAQTTVDAQAPGTPTINPSNGELFSGSAEAGATVLLLNAAGQVIGQTTANGSGQWQFSFSSPLPNGTVVKVTATDAVGNVSQPAQVTVDSGVVAQPVLDPSNGSVISGTAGAGVTVTLTDGNGNPIGQVTADGSGHWSFTPGVPLANGTVINAVATSGSAQSATVTTTVDAVAPPAPVVNLSNGSAVSGTAEAGAKVILTDGNGNPLGTVTTDGSGHWSFTPATALPNGTVVNAVSQDAAGNTSGPASVIVDSAAPAAPVLNASNGVTFTGTAEAGATVILKDASGNVIGQVTADAVTGQWSFTPATPLANGTPVSAVAVDATGNQSGPASTTVDNQAPAAPTIDASNGSVLEGSAEANARVTLTDGAGNPIGQVTADGSGHWSFTPASPLDNGTQVRATATDAAGNTSQPAQTVVDSQPPGMADPDPSNGDQVSGTAEPGSTVMIFDAQGDWLGDAAVGSNGVWTFTFAQRLPSGFVLHFVVRDAAGNTGAESTTTVDNSLTAPPNPTPSNGETISGTAAPNHEIIVSDSNGNVIGQTTADGDGHWTVTPDSPLPDGTQYQVVAVDPSNGQQSVPVNGTVDAVAPPPPSVNGSTGASLSGSAEAGSTVNLTDGNGNPIGQTTANGSGQWTYTPAAPLPDGTVVNVTATDAAGNTSPIASTTVDSVPPPTPVIDPSNGQLFTGTAEVGATVILRDAGGNVIGQVTADGSGHWSFAPQPALPNGTQISAQAVDAAGNSSITAAVTVDAQPPAAPVVTPSSGTELGGTAEPNAQVVVISANGQVIAEVPVGANGTWSYTPSSPLPDGTTLSIVAVDSAGNRSGTTTVTVDSTPPADPVVNPSNGTSISGTAEPGSTVTVTDGNGNPVGQTTADGSGHWSITPATPLPNGTGVTVVATDAAGNPSNGTSTIVDSTAPTAPVAAPSNGAVITGTGEEGSTLVFTDAAGNSLGQLVVGAGGNWTFTPNQALADGTVVTIVARDAAGNQAAPVQLTVDAAAPTTPTLDPSNGTVLGGTGEIGSTVIVSVGGSEVARVVVDQNGHWSYTPGAPLANGSAISVQATDAAGNTTPVVNGSVDSLAPPAPQIDPSAGSTFSGTGEAGATVILSGPGGEIGRAVVNADGHWTFTSASPIANGASVTAVAQDAAGNTSGSASVVIDSTPPITPTIDPSNGIELHGTAEIGSTITLVYANNVLIGQATTDGSGNWTFVPNPPLADGTRIDVVAQDAAGNASPVASIVIDAVAPPAPVVAPSNGSALSGTAEAGSTVIVSLGGVELGRVQADTNGSWTLTPSPQPGNGDQLQVVAEDAAGNVSVATPVTIDALPPPAPSISVSNGEVLTGTAEAGSTVLLSDGNGNPIGQATADGNGHWSFTPGSVLGNGSEVVAVARDAAGNVSTPAVTVIDSTLPSAPIIDPSNGTLISGTAEANALVRILDSNGATLFETNADASGHWAWLPTIPLANGTQISAVVVEGALVSGETSITVDAVAPNAPTIEPSNGQVLSGSAEASSTLILTDGSGNPIGQVSVDASGHWSFTPATALANGTVVNAVAVDAAGNASASATAVVDAVAPANPQINASNGNVVTGTAEGGATVILTDGNGNLIGKVVADASTGQWSFTANPPLLGGTTVNAVAQDAAGNTSGPASTLVDTTAPTTPTILPSNGAVLSGTGEIGSSIVLTDGNGNPIGQVTVDGNGKWSFTPAAPLANGTQVNAMSVDAAGNQSSSVNTLVDNSAPANPTINLSNGTLLTGSAEAGSLVLLSDGNGNAIGQVRADSNGAWSLAVSPALANGTVVNAVAKDAAGNTSGSVSTTIDSVAPPPPTIAASNGTELHGTAENNATVLLTDSNGNVIGQTTANGSGAWSFTPTSPLANGTVVNAVARDATGNTSGAVNTTIDNVAPNPPTINPSNGTVLAGTAEANATVILTDGNGNPIGQVTADSAGRWSFTPGSQLANGTLVNAVARDAAGNSSGAASTTVDSVAPPQPTINPTNGAHLLGTAEAGSTVILTDGNGNAIGQVTADGTGHWTFNPATALANGTTVNVVARDAAGNTSLSASTVVDSVAPPTPTIQPSNGTALAGTGEINATIILRDGNGNLIGTAQVDGTGHWQFAPSPALANGTTVNAVAQDAAGNTSGPASTVVDALAPNPPVVDPCNGSIISGTAEANASITLKVGSVVIAAITADASGHWSFTPGTALGDGVQVSVTAADAAGNVSGVTNVVVDAIAPLVPTLMASDGAVFAGTAEANSTIILRVGATVLAEVKVDANGNWQYVPSVAVADGLQVSVSARDAAGNVGPSVSVVVDSELPAIPVITPSNGTVISGTAEANATILITNSLGAPIGQVVAGVDGSWSFTPGTPLANGTVLNVVARDGSGNLSAAAVMVIDSVAPTVPVVTPSNGSALAGTAEAGASVILSVAGVPIATVTADASGHWSYTPGTALLNGVVVSVVARDAAGNTSVAASVTVDRIPPNTPIVAASNGVTFSGTAEANSTVIISGANGALLGQVTAGANGAWTFTPTTPIANGVVVSVVAKDAAGNVSVVAATTTVDAVAPPLPVINPSNGTLLAGTAEAGATVILSVGGTVIGQVTANALGQWSFTPGSALANNTQVSVVARDAVGNTSVAASVTVDAVAPTAPVVSPSNGSVLSGTAEIGSTVILKVGGAIIAQVTADATGHWSFAPGTALANNTQVSVTAKDAAGNVSVATTVSVDSVAPVAPSGLSVNASGTVLTGIAEANSTVKVIINGDSANPITVQANGSGNFTVNLSPALTAGQLLTVNASDAAGNVGTAIQIQAPDLTRPVLTIAEAADGYINKAELADGIQVRVGLTAGARAGQTLTLTYNGPGGYTYSQGHVLTAAEILAGVALITVLPTAGVGVIPQGAATITADVNGGLTAVPAGFTLDTIAPANPVLSLVGNLLTIAAEPSSTLLVDAKLLGLVSHTEVSANNAGLASLDLLSGLATTMSWDQLLDASVTVGARDAAGNVGNLVGINLENVLTQNTVTIGNLGLAVGLLPPVLGLSGTAIAGGSLGVEIITPLLNVALHPIVDSTGHFTINLLAPDLLAQLGLSVTQLLNLGSQLSINLIAYDAAGHASATYGISLTGSGLSLALGEISVTGTAGADVLMGTSGTEHFYGNAGADLFLHVGTGDIVQAGDGNDTIQLQSTTFKSVDGGAGFDTVILDSGINLTYGSLFTGTMTNIERISLGKGDAAPSSLTLTAAQVDAVTDANNVLQITGDTNDTLTVKGAVDTGVNQLHGGVSYDVYTFGNTTLLVEENTVHVVVS